MNEGYVVYTGRDVRYELTDPLAGLASLLPLPRTLHHGARTALKQLHLATGIEFLAAALNQRGLVIEGVALARSAGHEELHHSLSFGRVVRRAFEHLGQCNAAQTATEV